MFKGRKTYLVLVIAVLLVSNIAMHFDTGVIEQSRAKQGSKRVIAAELAIPVWVKSKAREYDHTGVNLFIETNTPVGATEVNSFQARQAVREEPTKQAIKPYKSPLKNDGIQILAINANASVKSGLLVMNGEKITVFEGQRLGPSLVVKSISSKKIVFEQVSAE